jgi:hypothetical protein
MQFPPPILQRRNIVRQTGCWSTESRFSNSAFITTMGTPCATSNYLCLVRMVVLAAPFSLKTYRPEPTFNVT